MMTRSAFTLMEILIVIIVIGILAAVALPNFSKIRYDVIDKEARSSLSLIQAAQKIYRMEVGYYYPEVGWPGAMSNTAINTNLKLALPTAGNYNWDYTSESYAAGPQNCSQATLNPGAINPGPARTWRLLISGSAPTSVACP